MIRKRVFFFAGFLLTLMSCNLNMLDAESEEVFKHITGGNFVFSICNLGKDDNMGKILQNLLEKILLKKQRQFLNNNL